MRRFIQLLQEYREVQLKQQGREARISEVRDMFRHMDNLLTGVQLSGKGFDGPETSLSEVMTSADFNYALGEFVQRRMIPGYQAKGFDFEPFIKPETAVNFMPHTRTQDRNDTDNLELVLEKGPARPGSRADAVKRQHTVEVWEKQFDFSMRTLVNDDLGYLADQADKMSRSARRTVEQFVSRMYMNATSINYLAGLGLLYYQFGRLTSTRISEARMAFNQRTNASGNPITARMTYLVYHSGLADTVAQIQASELVPELATNARNVVRNTFVAIEDPHMAGTAPNLPWRAFTDWRTSGIVPLILARRDGVPAPILARKTSNMEVIGSLLGGGATMSPVWGDFASGNIVVKVHDEWGTYNDAAAGNIYDERGCYGSAGTAA